MDTAGPPVPGGVGVQRIRPAALVEIGVEARYPEIIECARYGLHPHGAPTARGDAGVGGHVDDVGTQIDYLRLDGRVALPVDLGHVDVVRLLPAQVDVASESTPSRGATEAAVVLEILTSAVRRFPHASSAQ